MHWFADTNQLQPEPNHYQAADASQVTRSWPKQNQIPSRYTAPPDGPRRRRAPGLSAPQGRRTALLRHNWDNQDYLSPEPDRRWYDRELPKRWVHDSSHAPELRDPSVQEHQFRRHWVDYPNQYQYEPKSQLDRHKASRREVAEDADGHPRWSEDHGQGHRRRINASNQHQCGGYANEPAGLDPRYDKPSPNRRWAPISQRRLTAIPNVLVRPDIEGSFPRTRRWRADPSHDRESPQIPVNYILPPQTAGFSSGSHQHTLDYGNVPPQQPVDYRAALRQQPVEYKPPKHAVDYESVPQHPAMDYGSALPQPPVDFGAMLPQQTVNYAAVMSQQPVDYSALFSQQPVDYGTLLPQQAVDYRALLPQQPVDYRAMLPQQPLDYRAAFPQHPVDYGQMSPQQMVYGWYPANGNTQMDYGTMMTPRTMNYALPTVDYGTVSALQQGTDRKGATSAPPNLMWSSEIPAHFHSKAT